MERLKSSNSVTGQAESHLPGIHVGYEARMCLDLG